jgi:excisionase family DNA binding protein
MANVAKNHNSTLPTTSAEEEKDEEIDINNLPDLLTVREVADLLRVSTLTIKRWVKRGKLSAIRINTRGDLRFKKNRCCGYWESSLKKRKNRTKINFISLNVPSPWLLNQPEHPL